MYINNYMHYELIIDSKKQKTQRLNNKGVSLLICMNLSHNLTKNEVKLFDFLALFFSEHGFIMISTVYKR